MSRIWIIEKKEPPPYGRTVWAWVDYNKAGVQIKGWYLAKRIETGMVDDYETVNPFTFKTDTFSRDHNFTCSRENVSVLNVKGFTVS